MLLLSYLINSNVLNPIKRKKFRNRKQTKIGYNGGNFSDVLNTYMNSEEDQIRDENQNQKILTFEAQNKN